MLLLLKWKVPLLPSYMPSWYILNSVWIHLYLKNHKSVCNELLKPVLQPWYPHCLVSVISSLSTQGACSVEHEPLCVILPDPQWLTQRHPCSQTLTVSSCVLGHFFPCEGSDSCSWSSRGWACTVVRNPVRPEWVFFLRAHPEYQTLSSGENHIILHLECNRGRNVGLHTLLLPVGVSPAPFTSPETHPDA